MDDGGGACVDDGGGACVDDGGGACGDDDFYFCHTGLRAGISLTTWLPVNILLSE